MGKSGPRPIPSRVRELRGTDTPGRMNPLEPQPEAGPVTMPRGVLPASARKMWREWAPELQRLGLLTPLDAPMFTLTCMWAGVALDAAKEIRNTGLIDEDSRGRERKSRALSVLRAASSELRQLSRCFGLSPADRPDLVAAPEEADDLEKLLFRRVMVGGHADTE